MGPINNWEVFVGGFAAVAGIVSAIMLGALASIPLVLLSGFFFVLAGVVLLAQIAYYMERYNAASRSGYQGLINGAGMLANATDVRVESDPAVISHPAIWVARLGVIVAAQIPSVFTNVFTTASSVVWNVLYPEKAL